MIDPRLSHTIPVSKLRTKFVTSPHVFRYQSPIGLWLQRVCNSCHQLGSVGVYERPGGEAEAMAFISRPDWVCPTCARYRDEAQNAQNGVAA